MLPQFEFAASVVSGGRYLFTTNQIELTSPPDEVSVIKHNL